MTKNMYWYIIFCIDAKNLYDEGNVKSMADSAGSRRVATAKKVKSKGKINFRKMMVVIVAAVVAVYFVYILISQQISISQKNREIENLREQVVSASEESERLSQEVENLNDPEYLERVAREKLGLVRPNERVFVDSNKSEDNSR